MSQPTPDSLKRRGLEQVRDNLQPGDRVQPSASLFAALFGAEVQRIFEQHKARRCAGNK